MVNWRRGELKLKLKGRLRLSRGSDGRRLDTDAMILGSMKITSSVCMWMY